MAGRRRKKGRQKDERDGVSLPSPFNPALPSVPLKRVLSPPLPAAPKAPPPPPVPPQDDTDLFLEAVQDVRPLSDRRKRVVRDPDPQKRPGVPANAEDLETLAHLYDLVTGITPLDFTFSDEYMEGCVRGFDHRLMAQLKKGIFPVQTHLDLHGLTRGDAEAKVRDFLIKSHRTGQRCVLIVHGRGLNSENALPVLKEKIPLWLSRGPVGRLVLAFCTAQPYDGGTGAVYVLLRKRNPGAHPGREGRLRVPRA